MKRLLYAVCIAAIAIAGLNCQKELSNISNPNPAVNTPAPVTSTLQGKIIDENGNPAANVNISVGTKTTTTDARGFFRITQAALDKNASLVTAEKAGYFKAYRTFQATAATNHVEIKLIKRTMTGSVSSIAGGEVTLSNGGKINFAVSGIMKANGDAYSGTVNVYASYIDPTKNDIADVIPGSLMGDDKDGKRVSLTSYGMVAVELESAAGEKLQIATGKKATLTMPIPVSQQSSAPATIALWYIDEQSGIWKEQGTATKTGSNYVGEVTHFSFWNYDIGTNGTNLSMTVKTTTGVPFAHVRVYITATFPNGSIAGSGYGYTDVEGKVNGLVPIGLPLHLMLLSDCYNIVYSQDIGPFTQPTDIGTITPPASTTGITTISGRILNCTGAPVTNGYALFNIPQTYNRYGGVNSNGEFSFAVLACPTATSFEIIGVDNTTAQQGVSTIVPLVSPATNVGTITACGTSSLQFINYTLNGVDYTLDPLNGTDSTSAGSYSLNPGYHTYFWCHDQINSKTISFAFSSPAMSPGTYGLTSLYANTTFSGGNVPPCNITITKFAQNVNDFFEGYFSGSYLTSGTTTVNTLSGTFRIRRLL